MPLGRYQISVAMYNCGNYISKMHVHYIIITEPLLHNIQRLHSCTRKEIQVEGLVT